MPIKQTSPVPSYDLAVSGELVGVTSATQLPDVPVGPGLAYLKANAGNSGSVYVGGAAVTVPNGATDTTSGYPLAAGEVLGPLCVTNLNVLYRICTGTGDALSYLVVR